MCSTSGGVVGPDGVQERQRTDLGGEQDEGAV